MSITIVADTLVRQAAYFAAWPDKATEAARFALNDVAARGGMKLLVTAIDAEVNFPPNYVKERMWVARKAYNSRLEVVIAGRGRPTSLARFAKTTSVATSRKQGVKVQVRRNGRSADMKSAFLIRLRAGKASLEDNSNLGLAVRLKKGGRVYNKHTMSRVQLDHNLYLLYGPSVDQVFRGVAKAQTPAILDLVESEFLRQFVRLTKSA